MFQFDIALSLQLSVEHFQLYAFHFGLCLRYLLFHPLLLCLSMPATMSPPRSVMPQPRTLSIMERAMRRLPSARSP